VSDDKIVKKMRDIFEGDWAQTPESKQVLAALPRRRKRRRKRRRRKGKKLLPARDHAAVEDLPVRDTR
jgi:hypothetical protein